jgi:hypothetical protein
MNAPTLGNPWGLTRCEVMALDAYAQEGSEIKAADVLGKDKRTVSTQLNRARIRMKARNRVECLLRWDRWRVAQQQPEKVAA